MARAKTIYEDFWFVAFQRGDGSVSLRSLVNSEEHILKKQDAEDFIDQIENTDDAQRVCKDIFIQAAEGRVWS